MPSTLWIVPPATRGSGGHRTIFNHANYMAERGYDVTLAFENAQFLHGYVSQNLKDYLEERYGELKAEIVEGTLLDREFDLGIATFWTTVFPLLRNRVKKKLYFVQDYEPWFYPVGDEYLLSRKTYDLLDNIVCIGRWLPNKLKESGCNANINFFDFGVNNGIYKDLDLRRSDSICVLYQPEKERRCPLLVENAVRILRRKSPDIDIKAFGSRMPLEVGGVGNLGVLSPDELAGLYSACRAGLVLSATNPSRVPFEMMACGLPVVDLAEPNTAYDFAENTLLRARPEPADLAEKLIRLCGNDSTWRTVHDASLTYMKGRTADRELSVFYHHVRTLAGGEPLPADVPAAQLDLRSEADAAGLDGGFYTDEFDFSKLQPRVKPKRRRKGNGLLRLVKKWS